MTKKLTLFMLVLSSASLFASGWRCNSMSGSWRLILNNHTTRTRVPAKVVVVLNDITVVSADEPDVLMEVTNTGTDYVTPAGALAADHLIFHVNFREGQESVSHGAMRLGQLLLVNDEDRTLRRVQLVCRRYLKSR